MENELKPCPFCGRKVATCDTVAAVSLTDVGETDYEWESRHYVVVCDYKKGGCGASTGKWYTAPEKAIEAWNRRGGFDG